MVRFDDISTMYTQMRMMIGMCKNQDRERVEHAAPGSTFNKLTPKIWTVRGKHSADTIRAYVKEGLSLSRTMLSVSI